MASLDAYYHKYNHVHYAAFLISFLPLVRSQPSHVTPINKAAAAHARVRMDRTRKPPPVTAGPILPASPQRASTSALHHGGPAPPASEPSVAIVTMTPSDPSDIDPPAAVGVVRSGRQRPNDRPPSSSSYAIPYTRARTILLLIPSARLTRDGESIHPPLRLSP
jgi:hypothetical protein